MLLIFAAQETAKKKFWILDPLYIALGTLLAWFYGVIPNYGIAIMLLTAAVCVLRMPLVAKQVKSQREMQRIQPELKRIQTKYKTDPQKRNEEMMKLYKEHGVNPFAGCLPVILQAPLFIVLYRLILNLSSQPPKHIPTSSELYRDLVASGGKLQAFGMDLAESASKVSGFTTMIPYLLLIALVVGTGLYQQRQMTARMPAAAMNTQMQIMGKVVPVFLGFISWSVPAGVVLYFLVSNLFQIGQQAYLFRKKDEPPAAGGGKKAIDTKVAPDDDDDDGEAAAAPATGLAGLLNKLMKAPATEATSNGPAASDKEADIADTERPAAGEVDGDAGERPAPKRQPAKPPPAKGQPNRNQRAKSSNTAKSNTAKPKPAASPAPAPSGGLFSRLFGGGAPKTAPRPKSAPSRSTKPASNGKGASGGSRTSGRAQPKGQSGSKSKSRNSRRSR